jgi:hypothetical protein
MQDGVVVPVGAESACPSPGPAHDRLVVGINDLTGTQSAPWHVETMTRLRIEAVPT